MREDIEMLLLFLDLIALVRMGKYRFKKRDHLSLHLLRQTTALSQLDDSQLKVIFQRIEEFPVVRLQFIT